MSKGCSGCVWVFERGKTRGERCRPRTVIAEHLEQSLIHGTSLPLRTGTGWYWFVLHRILFSGTFSSAVPQLYSHEQRSFFLSLSFPNPTRTDQMTNKVCFNSLLPHSRWSRMSHLALFLITQNTSSLSRIIESEGHGDLKEVTPDQDHSKHRHHNRKRQVTNLWKIFHCGTCLYE